MKLKELIMLWRDGYGNLTGEEELSFLRDEGIGWGSNISLGSPEVIESPNLSCKLLRFQLEGEIK